MSAIYLGTADAEQYRTIMALGEWANNSELIADVAHLGYLRKDDKVLDPTYGMGNFWNNWRPTELVRSDILPERSPDFPDGLDATRLPREWSNGFDAVVLDPPYKLTGTDAGAGKRYGLDEKMNRKQRHALMGAMLTEAKRVVKPGGYVLFRCQDQVESGRVRWQSRIFSLFGEDLGLELVDEFLFPSYRAQPKGRTQQHARRNVSQLLVFRKPKNEKPTQHFDLSEPLRKLRKRERHHRGIAEEDAKWAELAGDLDEKQSSKKSSKDHLALAESFATAIAILEKHNKKEDV